MITLNYKEFTIELFDERQENPAQVYDHIYQPEKNREYDPVSQTGITVYREGVKISSVLLQAVAGATSVTSDSAVIARDVLMTRCCNTVFSVSLPDLKLNWMTEVDWATCFSLHAYNDDFISHGEMSVSRIDATGKILWQFSGADIFVDINGQTTFEMFDDHIALADFNGTKYTIDYNGNLLTSTSPGKNANMPPGQVKPWWKFW